MIKEVIATRDPKLRQETKKVTKIDKKILEILRDMKDTLRSQKDPPGVGLAATQIGVPLQIFLMMEKGVAIPVFNPKIITLSEDDNDPKNTEEEYIMEGCLSLPHYYGPVKRSWKVELKYDSPVKKENGEWYLEARHETFEGFIAQVIQHETDHLNGKLFIDRLLEQNRILYQLKGKKWEEVELP